MKRLAMLVLAVLFSTVANAAPGFGVAERLSYETQFVPMGQTCQQYFSLLPPGHVCLEGNLYFTTYRVKYDLNGKLRTATLHYIPEDAFVVDRNGLPIPPNHTIAMEHRY